MTTPAHIAAYIRLKDTPKQVILDDLEVVLHETKSTSSTAHEEWTTSLPVYDERGRKMEKCEVYIAWRSSGLTEWVACFIVAGKAVIKMDSERRDKIQRPPVEDDKKGRLNTRRPVTIPKGTPHWRVIDQGTGELGWKHFTDETEFPRGITVHEAVPKFFARLANIGWPTGVTFYRLVTKTGKREKLTMKTLFE